MRRYDQRNMSDTKIQHMQRLSATYLKKDRAKDVEQIDEDTHKFENRFGTIRNEEKMLAVKTLMPESLLNYRFRGTTMSL